MFNSLKTLFQNSKQEFDISSFSYIQKIAVLKTMYVVASCDGENHIDEFFLIEDIILDFDLSTENVEDDLRLMTNTKSFEVLSTFNITQQTWYVKLMLSLIKADGKSMDIEMEYLTIIMNKAKYSKEVVSNAVADFNKLNK